MIIIGTLIIGVTSIVSTYGLILHFTWSMYPYSLSLLLVLGFYNKWHERTNKIFNIFNSYLRLLNSYGTWIINYTP